MATAPPNPQWKPGSLRRHHRKRTTGKEAGYFEDLLGVSGRTITEVEYDQRSRDAIANAWAEYEGEAGKASEDGYYEASVYFVDDDLVVAILTFDRGFFHTCYRKHFGNRHTIALTTAMTAGQRRLRYREQLKLDERGKMIINVRRIRGFTDA